MSTKITKDDLKQDQIQAELQKGFKWTTKHLNIVLGGLGAFLVVGVLYSGLTAYQSKKEAQRQEEFYVLEKSLLDAKKNVADAKSKDKAYKVDFEKDFLKVSENLKKFAVDYSDKKAGRMAGILLVDLYRENQKLEQAQEFLKQIEKNLKKNEILSGLIQLQWGSVLADLNQCEGAVTQWESVVNQKNLSFAHGETKLRMSLCYQAMGQFEKAETLLTEVSKKQGSDVDFSASQDAEKYLKYLRAQKNLLGSGS